MINCDMPTLITLASYDGNYELYEKGVYEIFEELYLRNKLHFNGTQLALKTHPLFKDKSATFWHLTSEGKDECNRIPDLRRYERIKWPAYLISFCIESCQDILIWENKRKNKARILIWCQSKEYLVILDKRNTYMILWTAYPVTINNQKQKLLKEYTEYEKAKAAQQ